MPPKPITTAEDQIEYLLRVLKHCDLPKPNFKDLATELGISSANNAQKRFKAIVEASGKFKLVNNQIVSNDQDDDNNEDDSE